MFFFNNIASKKTVFWYVRVCQNTHRLHWWPYIGQHFHSTNDCYFCLIYLKMSLEIAIYIKFWYTFSFLFRPFYIITNWACSALLWDSHFQWIDEFTWPWGKGVARKKKWFVTHIKGKRVGIEIIAALFHCFSKQLVNLPSFLWD